MTMNTTAQIFKTNLLFLLMVFLSTGSGFAQGKEKIKKADNPKTLTETKDRKAGESGAAEKSGKNTEKKTTAEKGSPDQDKKEGEPAGVEGGEENLLDEKKGAQFKFKGQVKNLLSFHETDNFMGENPFSTTHKDLVADITRLRLSPEFLYNDILQIKVDWDNEIIPSNYGNTLTFTNYWRLPQYNDFLHLIWEPYYDDTFYYRTKIHRAYIKVSVDHFTATIGRQQIRYGGGRLWNPLDILNPVSPTYIEGSEDQKGTDAIKLDFFPNDKTEISIVYDLKRSNDEMEHFNMQDCNYILRAKTSIKDTDIALMGGYMTRRGFGGIDFASIVLDGMLRGSLIVSQAPEPYLEEYNPLNFLRYTTPGKDIESPVYFQANAGYEYTFKVGVYFLFEYFYNQRGVNYDKDLKMAYSAFILGTRNQKTYMQLANQFLTINQHYLGLALGYDFHPLVRGEFFTIGDIQGQGIFWSPTLKINAYENLDFTIGVMGAFVFNDKTSDFSEFRKNYMYYLSISYVF